MQLNLRALADQAEQIISLAQIFFGSQTATLTRQNENIAVPKVDISIQIDDTLYELPKQPYLELVCGLIDTLG